METTKTTAEKALEVKDAATAATLPALAIRAEQTRFDAAQVAALRQIGVSGVDTATLDMFFSQCHRTGLDPFARQIYLIQRGGKYSIQTSIDGFRLVATRTGVYAGSKESWVFGDGGQVVSATVTVYRIVSGRKCGFEATSHYVEYVQECFDKKLNSFGPNSMWQKFPARMLAKCAESLALRKAFPQELSGLYTSDEMPAEEEPKQQQPGHGMASKSAKEEKESFEEKQQVAVVDAEFKEEHVWKKEEMVTDEFKAFIQSVYDVQQLREIYKRASEAQQVFIKALTDERKQQKAQS